MAKRKIWLPNVDKNLATKEAASENIPDSSMTITESCLPSVDVEEYGATRVRIANEEYIRKLLAEDLEQLKRDRVEKAACHEEDQVYYLDEAIEFCES